MFLSIIIKYAWICLNKQCSECALGSKHFKILNMAVFSTYKRYTAFWVCLDRVLNICWFLNISGFWIRKGYKYAKVTQGSKNAKIWLNMSEEGINVPQYLWIYNDKQGFDYFRALNIPHTMHSAMSLYKFMSTYWEIGVFIDLSKIYDRAL